MAAWGVLLPLFAGPDENSNYIRAAAVIRGEFVGGDLPPGLVDNYFRTTVDIDPQFGAANLIPFCFAPMREVPACNTPLDTAPIVDDPPFTHQGRYPPAAFVVPGIGTLVGPTDMSVRWGRLANSAVVATLLGLAAARLARSAIELGVLLVAFAPGVQFSGAVINPSGVEIAAAIAVWVYLPAALKGRRGTWTRRDDVALAVASVALISARPVGIAVFAIVAACCMVAVPGNPVTTLLRRAPITIASAAVTSLAMLAWYVVVFDVHLDDGVADGVDALSRAGALERSVGHVTELVGMHVGNFGWLEVPAPRAVVWFFLVLISAMVVVSWSGLTGRERLAVVALGLATFAFSVYLDLRFYSLLRLFGTQGRHLSPLIVGVPLLLAHRWHPSRSARWLIAASWVAAVFASGLFALRRYAVGEVAGNFLDLFTDPIWSPPFGVPVVLIALFLATLGVALVGTVDLTGGAAAPGREPRVAAPSDAVDRVVTAGQVD